MTIQNKNVPALRFSEFDGSWIETKLDRVIVEYKAKSVLENQYTVLTSSNKGLMKQTDYYGENRITEKENKGFNIIPDGYITYRSRSDNRKFTFNVNNLGITGIISTYYPVFSIKDGSNKFFIEYLNSKYHYIGKYSVGTSQTVLSLNGLKNIKLKYPLKKEQQKIAAFLTVVDRKIQQLANKKVLLEQYKKGVMQKIFNQEIRFKDDKENDFADWEEKKLCEVANIVKRKLSKAESIPVMTISAGSGFLNQQERFSKVIAGTSLKNYTALESGELAYNRGNSKTAKYGCIYVMKENLALVPYVYHCFKLNENYDPQYFEYFASTNLLDKQLKKIISSSARMDGLLNVSQDNFFRIKIKFPCFDEQTKIADFLSSIDDKINSVNQQLEKTKEYKKGLLQQMFV